MTNSKRIKNKRIRAEDHLKLSDKRRYGRKGPPSVRLLAGAFHALRQANKAVRRGDAPAALFWTERLEVLVSSAKRIGGVDREHRPNLHRKYPPRDPQPAGKAPARTAGPRRN